MATEPQVGLRQQEVRGHQLYLARAIDVERVPQRLHGAGYRHLEVPVDEEFRGLHPAQVNQSQFALAHVGLLALALLHLHRCAHARRQRQDRKDRPSQLPLPLSLPLCASACARGCGRVGVSRASRAQALAPSASVFLSCARAAAANGDAPHAQSTDRWYDGRRLPQRHEQLGNLVLDAIPVQLQRAPVAVIVGHACGMRHEGSDTRSLPPSAAEARGGLLARHRDTRTHTPRTKVVDDNRGRLPGELAEELLPLGRRERVQPLRRRRPRALHLPPSTSPGGPSNGRLMIFRSPQVQLLREERQTCPPPPECGGVDRPRPPARRCAGAIARARA